MREEEVQVTETTKAADVSVSVGRKAFHRRDKFKKISVLNFHFN